MEKITDKIFQEILTKNEKFSEYIINKYPILEADIRSYRLNPNCSCRTKITNYFNENQKDICESIRLWAVETFTDLGSFIVSPDLNHLNVLKTNLPSLEWIKYKDMIGEIVEILPDPNEYKKIISVARSEWLYNGINILETVKFDPETKKESVVWLLLFY